VRKESDKSKIMK